MLYTSHRAAESRPAVASGFSRLIWLPFLFLVISGLASAREEPARILILFSNDRLLPANQRFEEGISRALDPDGNQSSLAFYSEFLDSSRLTGSDQQAAFEDYLVRRYRECPPQLIVTLGSEALKFLIKRRDTIFPGVPLLFGGTDPESFPPDFHTEGLSGQPMRLKLAPVVESLLDMRPETREILLVHGSSRYDRALRDMALEQCAELEKKVKITDFPELPLNELTSRLGKLNKDQTVFYLTYFQSPDGADHTPARVASTIAETSAVPVIGPFDTYIGTGVLAARVSRFEEEGVALGNLARRVLDGEQPGEIGFLPLLPPRLIVDDRQAKKWGIKSLPEGTDRRFRELTLWERYPVGTPVAITILILQGALIGGLLWIRVKERRAVKELRLSEERFSGIFRGSPAAISIIRQADGKVIDVNPSWEMLTRISREDAMGKTLLENGMAIEGDAEARLRRFLDSGKPLQDYEQKQLTPDGQTRFLSISTEPHILHGEPCIIIVAKDITADKMEDEQRRKLARTGRLAMLGEMTASIAHELNQPLGAILSNADAAEMLLERPSPPLDEIRLILADIRRDDFRASEVIKRVRSLVGSREAKKKQLDLNSVIVESLKLATPEARRQGVSLVHELDDELPPIHADRVQIEQILLNFLLNALEAMKETPLGSRSILVSSSLARDASVVASVRDHGHGIPPDRLDRLFDSFFTTKENGMGLGLSLARSIAEAHGGSVHAENNASNGATFHLILPKN